MIALTHTFTGIKNNITHTAPITLSSIEVEPKTRSTSRIAKYFFAWNNGDDILQNAVLATG